jgi:hypothetical protein
VQLTVTLVEDKDAFLRRAECYLRIETPGRLGCLGCFGGYHFCFNPDMHTHIALGTGQEKKLRPDQDKQQDIDNALEARHRLSQKYDRCRNFFVIV